MTTGCSNKSVKRLFQTRLACEQPKTADLVKLRYFAGFTNAQAAAMLSISPRQANDKWAFAKAWLHERIFGCEQSE